MSEQRTNGTAPLVTFEGEGFGSTRAITPIVARSVPAVASQRAYLRDGLPGLYQDNEFGMRFVGSLETLLDPIVAMLDALPSYFSADHAPADLLLLLAAWVGIELDEAQPLREKREVVRRAAELHRRRGTVAGLRLALELAFPDVPLRVEDTGGVTFGENGADEAKDAGKFVVYCDKPLSEEVLAAISRRIEDNKPVHTTFRLRVKSSGKAAKA